MIITREYIDEVTPRHERTSCSDNRLENAWGGWYGKYDPNNGQKVINHPRCTRCYLLAHEGEDTDNLEFGIRVYVDLVYKGS